MPATGLRTPLSHDPFGKLFGADFRVCPEARALLGTPRVPTQRRPRLAVLTRLLPEHLSECAAGSNADAKV